MQRSLVVVLVVLGHGCLEPALPMSDGTAPVDAGPFVCSPLTCTGCCRANQCLGGNRDDACGYDGRACRTCEASLRCESPGACFLRPRDGGVDAPTRRSDAGAVNLEVLQRCQFLYGFVFCG